MYKQIGGRYDTKIGTWALDFIDKPTEIKLLDFAIEYTDNPKEQMKGLMPGKASNGRYIKNYWEACPVCGSKRRRREDFNNLCQDHLAGSSGHYDICEDCGYKHQVIEVIS